MIYDVAIIGGGPVGLFASYYSKLRNMNSILIESLPTLGGQPATLYPQKSIYDVAGFFGITGEDLIQRLIAQLNEFNMDTLLSTTVQSIENHTDYKLIITDNTEIKAKTVIIAIGNGAFNPRKLAINYDTSLDETNIDYFVPDINKYKDKEVLIAGGGDSAVDWALAIDKIAKKTSLVHRRDQFRALKSSVTQLEKSSINKITPYLISEITKNDSKVEVTFSKVREKENKKVITVDNILVNYGYTSDSKLLRDWGLELRGSAIKVNQKMETNIEGIFAIGDIADYDGKLKLITNGFSEGPIAVAQAQKIIDPSASYYEHSTNMFE